MTYWMLDSIFLGVAVVVAIVAIIVRRPPRWWAVLGSFVVLIALSVIFDNVMIGIRLVGYNRSLISGVFIGRAPIEDFAYTAAAVLLLPSIWALVGGRAARA